jgi:hypothetical protein
MRFVTQVFVEGAELNFGALALRRPRAICAIETIDATRPAGHVTYAFRFVLEERIVRDLESRNRSLPGG